jgi:hypothetical protein
VDGERHASAALPSERDRRAFIRKGSLQQSLETQTFSTLENRCTVFAIPSAEEFF